MVHTINRSNYSVQPGGCGHGRGKPSPRKKHMEDSRVSPHSPRSAPTNFDLNSESELINDNISSVEKLLSGRNRNLSMPIQGLVQSSQRGGVGNIPKPLAGEMNSYLHIKSFLGQEKNIELLGGLSPLSCKDKVKTIKNWLKNQSLLSIDQKKELEMTPDLEKEGPVASTSSKPAPEVSKDKPKRPHKKQKGPKNHQGKGKGKENWHRAYPQGYRIPKLEPSAVDSVFNISRTLMEFTAKEQEKRDKPLTWFLKQKDRLSALHPDMSDSMINIKILRKCGGELEHAIKCRCGEPCSTGDYINAMENIITRTRTGKAWTKNPMESRMTQRISRDDKKPERPVLKCHKCGST
ncbi:hypothetical protein O181_104812 [Austropuccinia psidii MF-1]|uniref:Uncharacterized protein n=1 Tax=Austropuccinia psidii MF-1 TaxID=1389203 RepID=A0A9Q3JNV3_9BASI|nr:hypothetical protein [Austropuccinia psidii MF-1]